MASSSSSDSFKEIYERNVDTVYRVCYIYMKNVPDTQDAVHNAFLRLLETNKKFTSPGHEKAWLIRVSVNICKNMLAHWSRRNVSLSEAESITADDCCNEVIIQLSELPDKLKIPVYLHYYDGYTSEEIGKMLHISASAVRNRLQRAREMLKTIINDERSD